ncbi:hypothetical protein NDU88_007459 [Pleurodeles waltl]|uniref:Secreted protein n=1 Tax=Pleurodeles waltl TaxID=8319 RepID=A0AAV7PTN6_PLEWA|nr:hypothetical protein NDU88_007459 [Pleurodeles waltl]
MSRRLRLTTTLALIEGQMSAPRGPAPPVLWGLGHVRSSTAGPAPPACPASTFLAWDAGLPRRPWRFVRALVLTARGSGSSFLLPSHYVARGSYLAVRARSIQSFVCLGAVTMPRSSVPRSESVPTRVPVRLSFYCF